ncbi:MAG TPA: indole-3-glycerol phosphate synthase TrpC [Candidatus Udaeobacter sp.]|jgi:indole-3-glycerol phosphate synthase|nr:indole-3-glycerol phosphate synthase TrpC [Candidatus Udaeobacter sp.]
MSASRTDFLSRIADDRRRRIAALQVAQPAHRLRERLPRIQPAGRLERALRRSGAGAPLKLLCEIKRASPSRGVLRADLDPVAMATLYQRSGASAISIVTEPDHFQGELEWVNAVRPQVTIPILLKDFMLDSYQILDAAVRGADGILLIAALLSETQLQRLITEARLVGLDCLVEVHTAAELRVALRSGATLVGVNNRDLRTFEVRLETALDLLPLVPPMVTAVAESGISTPEDLARLRATRCDAVLMGEVLMKSGDPGAALGTLIAAARG